MSLHYRPIIIDRIEDETADAFSLFFRNPDPKSYPYLPGQYLTLRLTIDGEEYRRVFSLSSSPQLDEQLSVTIKRIPGGVVSNYIRENLKAGDEVEVLPPLGKFCVRPKPINRVHYVLIGAGSGITPLMSILRSVLHTEPDSRVSLWYCNKREDSIIFGRQLRELSETYAGRLEVVHSLTQPAADWDGYVGRLDEQRLYEMLGALKADDGLYKQYFLCGPDGLMEAAQAALSGHSVPASSINRELYSAPVPSDQDDAAVFSTAGEEERVIVLGDERYVMKTRKVDVILDDRMTTLSVRPDQSILDAAVEEGLDPPFACQSGICTTCRAMVHSGAVVMDETEGLSEEEMEEGYILTCQSHPLDDDLEVEYP